VGQAANVAPLKAGLSMHKMLPFDKRNAAQQVGNLCAGVAAVAAIAVAVAFIINCSSSNNSNSNGSSNSCCMWNATCVQLCKFVQVPHPQSIDP